MRKILKRNSIAFVVFSVVMSTASFAALPDWEDPVMIGMNKEPAHATLMPYESIDTALKLDRQGSPFYQSLNGEWKFNEVIA